MECVNLKAPSTGEVFFGEQSTMAKRTDRFDAYAVSDGESDEQDDSGHDSLEMIGIDEDDETTAEANDVPNHSMSRTRDEVQELQKLSRPETRRVGVLRILLTICLIASTLFISTVTYYQLRGQETKIFKTVVSCWLFCLFFLLLFIWPDCYLRKLLLFEDF